MKKPEDEVIREQTSSPSRPGKAEQRKPGKRYVVHVETTKVNGRNHYTTKKL